MKTIITLLFIVMSGKVLSWGQNGHRIVGEIAQNHLTTGSLIKVKALLGDDSLAEVSTWGDFIRSDEAWRHADPWHYVSIEDGKTYEKSPKNKKGDIIIAIKRYVKILANKKESKEKRQVALKLLVHFVGDIHQPLHVGKASDQGGNKILVKWFGKKTNLHVIWDESLIDGQSLSFKEYVEFLGQPSSDKIKNWKSAPLLQWASESMELRKIAYDLPKKQKKGWEYQYIFKTREIVNTRLLQAGIRLAKLIDDNI